MEELKDLNREIVIQAISEIKNKPDKRYGRESTTYDLVYEDSNYPPILVLSEANKIAGGEALTLSEFNNNTDKAFSILRELGFKVIKKANAGSVQKQLIKKYKDFIQRDQNQPELYKWKLIKEFERKWDIENDDFASMLQSINFENLIDFRSKTFIIYSKEYSEDARSLFKMLFDEEISLEKRIKDFVERSEEIVREYHPDKGAFQDERTIATYLTFRYPNKYTFYKFTLYSDYTELLNVKREKKGKKYIHYLELIDELIDDFISKDKELLKSSRNTLTTDCYIDDNFNILAQDILYRTTQRKDNILNNNKNYTNFDSKINKVWIEKTLVKNRSDRESGEYSVGRKLWSPQKDARGADIYRNMRKVEKGDLILHLTDNEAITGVSLAAEPFKEGQGVSGSDWEGAAYIIELRDYKKTTELDRDRILNKRNKQALDSIREEHDVFYNVKLNLRQGAYLTECPLDLLEIINHEYESITSESLPYLNSDFTVNNIEMNLIRLNNDLNICGLIYSEQLVIRFTTALSSKSFLILTGLSGSGKTKLAQAFADWICEDKNQINLVPVGADWTNREPLLGYPNALVEDKYVMPESGVLQLILRARKDSDRPYFLILDEMNLSHVERYFADFLSAIESNEEIKLHSGVENWDTGVYQVPTTIKIPKNLFVIGTVNIDETTYMFSPKVLDRANVIEFRVSQKEIEEFLKNPVGVDLEILRGQGASMAEDFVRIASSNAGTFSKKEDLTRELLQLFEELNTVGAEFGYRTAYEISRFAAIYEQLVEGWKFNNIMDAAVAQKLLPKLHGSRRKLEKVLFKLGDLCYTGTAGECEDLFKKPESIVFEKARFPVSFEKIVRMHKGIVDNGFTSFAEA